MTTPTQEMLPFNAPPAERRDLPSPEVPAGAAPLAEVAPLVAQPEEVNPTARAEVQAPALVARTLTAELRRRLAEVRDVEGVCWESVQTLREALTLAEGCATGAVETVAPGLEPGDIVDALARGQAPTSPEPLGDEDPAAASAPGVSPPHEGKREDPT